MTPVEALWTAIEDTFTGPEIDDVKLAKKTYKRLVKLGFEIVPRAPKKRVVCPSEHKHPV